jgi:hypothetical protein
MNPETDVKPMRDPKKTRYKLVRYKSVEVHGGETYNFIVHEDRPGCVMVAKKFRKLGTINIILEAPPEEMKLLAQAILEIVEDPH